MEFNLVRDKWIPIRRRDGTSERIAPFEITSDYEANPVVALDAPRPDFNGALIQFLIGLMQTVAAPENDIAWEDRLYDPPSSMTLEEAFSNVAHAFELGGGGPRFMQDFEVLEGNEWGIGSLLIDAPGENALRNNSDHFIKRGGVSLLCPACCSTALFALQTNAPSGGVGYRTSLRGGGPLTTLILPEGNSDTLWEMVWLNVLEAGVFLRTCGNPAKTAFSDQFPWLAETRSSDKSSGCDTTPEDVHPAQMYWGMPRRIRLILGPCHEGICDVCGDSTARGIRGYYARNYGVNYTGPWLHPLSPYNRDKEGAPLAVHAQPGGVSYRHWLGLVQEDAKLRREPARVVNCFREMRQRPGKQFRLWAFGYDMDNMKARCWYESVMPLIALTMEIREIYDQKVAGMIRAASEVAGNLRGCVKKAWFRRPSDVKGDTTYIDSVLWHATEAGFYSQSNDLRSALEAGDEATEVMQQWHEILVKTSLAVFDVLAWEGPVEDADPKRVVVARRDLMRFNRGRKITVDLLGLPISRERRMG